MTKRRGRPKTSSVETLGEAAVELFLEVGFERASIDDITARAGVSRGTFFSYFPGGKADALWSQLLMSQPQATEPAGDGIRHAAEMLVALVAPWGDRVPQVLRDAEVMRATDTLVDTAGPRIREITERLALRIAMDEDSLPESARPAVVSGALVGAALGAVTAWMRGPDSSAEDAVRAALEPLVQFYSSSSQ